jgi:hypothetical protein
MAHSKEKNENYNLLLEKNRVIIEVSIGDSLLGVPVS